MLPKPHHIYAPSVVLAAALGFSAPAYAQDQQTISYALQQAITQSATAVRAEVLKAFTAEKAVKEGLAAYREEQRLRESAITLNEKLTQPELLCHDLGVREVLTQGSVGGRAAAFRASVRHRTQVAASANPVAYVASVHQTTNQKFCDASEERQGICQVNASAAYANLAGADRDALFLFQSRSGADTYDGNRQSGQVEATNGYIARVVHGPSIPTPLQGLGSNGYDRTPQARAYIETQRRYDAFLSMARYSLTRIQESRMPKN